jgi:tRNA A-37 threonylcarbamoyl transferase component Bud32
LPLPAPDVEPDDALDAEEQVSRVRMSGYLPASRRDLPHLPATAWHNHDPAHASYDDEDDDDPRVSSRSHPVPPPPLPEPTRTVAGGASTTVEATRSAAEPTRTSVDTRAPVDLPLRSDRPERGDRADRGDRGDRGAPAQRNTIPARPQSSHPAVSRSVVHTARSRAAAPTEQPPLPPLPAPPPTPVPPSVPVPAAPPRSSASPTTPVPSRAASDGAGLLAGRYKISERIGQGGMGKVYKVTHAQLGKVFALKLVSEELASTKEARELFYREARLASSLSHQHIASVVDFGEDDKLGLFMVMEFVEGEPLAKLLHRERQLSVRLACDIILQCAEALHYIHSNDIVHCDIKTENILITEVQSTKRRQLQVKLLDFGLARSMRASRITTSLSGTPHYVAPERIRGEPPSPSSDIYGLGILFYELLTGKVPWDGHVAQILAGHLEQQPTPPSQLIEGGLDPALEALVLRALTKTPAQRHKDMAAFIYELRTVMDMLGFGRRARRGGARRVVIERTKNERDEMVRLLFEGCRLPLALVSPTGLITVANPSFARFVMGVDVEVEGLTVQSTPLVTAWDTFETDLARAIAGHGVRRILELEVGAGEVRRLLMWLDPSQNQHAILGVQPIDV